MGATTQMTLPAFSSKKVKALLILISAIGTLIKDGTWGSKDLESQKMGKRRRSLLGKKRLNSCTNQHIRSQTWTGSQLQSRWTWTNSKRTSPRRLHSLTTILKKMVPWDCRRGKEREKKCVSETVNQNLVSWIVGWIQRKEKFQRRKCQCSIDICLSSRDQRRVKKNCKKLQTFLGIIVNCVQI